jgi:hypothetical protein
MRRINPALEARVWVRAGCVQVKTIRPPICGRRARGEEICLAAAVMTLSDSLPGGILMWDRNGLEVVSMVIKLGRDPGSSNRAWHGMFGKLYLRQLTQKEA